MDGTSVILPFRGVDEDRIENLYSVVRFYQAHFPAWQLLIVEQDAESRLDLAKVNGTPTHIFAKNGGPFNKSWAVNIAATESSNSVLVVSDTDMILSPTSIKASVESVRQQLDFVKPFENLVDLSQAETIHYRDTSQLPDTAGDKPLDRTSIGEHLCLAGGVFVIRRDFYLRVNGLDERFQGWGGEDDAFSLVVQTNTKKRGVYESGMAWHLWHPRSTTRNQDCYQVNLQLLEAYRNEVRQGRRVSSGDQTPIGKHNKYESGST